MRKIFIVSIAFSAVLTMGLAAFAFDPGEPFNDVDYNSYYSGSAVKMWGRGIVQGYGDGNFGPNDPVTRAQLVTILDRYDSTIIDPMGASGIANLVTIICEGFESSDFEGNLRGQNAYENVCDSLIIQ